ncbi:MAG: Fur family transcriptional regulator [Anaerolineales bacterium]|jgi:Fe2+ or Zn2+ uptake regulation protein
MYIIIASNLQEGQLGELTVEAQSRIRAHGRRMTHQRRLILELLENRGGHPSAEELFVQARQSDPDINLSTVYRTVRWLEAEGLIEPRRFEGTARKERFDPRSPGDHHHFVCESCGQVTEFSESIDHEVSRRFEAKHGGRVSRARLVLYGLCGDCLPRSTRISTTKGKGP